MNGIPGNIYSCRERSNCKYCKVWSVFLISTPPLYRFHGVMNLLSEITELKQVVALMPVMLQVLFSNILSSLWVSGRGHKNWSYCVGKSSKPSCWACSVGGHSSAGQRSCLTSDNPRQHPLIAPSPLSSHSQDASARLCRTRVEMKAHTTDTRPDHKPWSAALSESAACVSYSGAPAAYKIWTEVKVLRGVKRRTLVKTAA